MGRSQAPACDNMNHRRPNPVFPYCIECGRMVNERLVGKVCDQAGHAQARRQRATYCVHCGTQLIVPR